MHEDGEQGISLRSKDMESTKKTRPTKKQHQALAFIKSFIDEHGYSPSYREIMKGCNYTSVATVALHVSNLIKRGHLVKRSKSARSLEVVSKPNNDSNSVSSHVHELVAEIEQRFEGIEKEVVAEILDEIYVLVGSLKILGHQEKAKEYVTRISKLN